MTGGFASNPSFNFLAGSVETIDRVTSHRESTFEEFGIIHYSVANIPAAVPRTSTFALTNVTLPYALEPPTRAGRRRFRITRSWRRALTS